jgi:hypothetical protein
MITEFTSNYLSSEALHTPMGNTLRDFAQRNRLPREEPSSSTDLFQTTIRVLCGEANRIRLEAEVRAIEAAAAVAPFTSTRTEQGRSLEESFEFEEYERESERIANEVTSGDARQQFEIALRRLALATREVDQGLAGSEGRRDAATEAYDEALAALLEADTVATNTETTVNSNPADTETTCVGAAPSVEEARIGVPDLAAKTGLKENTIREAARRKKIRSKKVGGKLMIAKASAREYWPTECEDI